MAESTHETTRRPLLKAPEVCDIAKVQLYVLRTWEKEFPDLGVTQKAGGPRFYRHADVERVLRIKHLVFSEGLTLAGARRRLDEERGGAVEEETLFEVVAVAAAPARAAAPVIPSDARQRIDQVKAGLRAILHLLGSQPARAAARSLPRPHARVVVASDAPLLPMDEGATPEHGDAAEGEPAKKRVRARRASS